MRYLARYSTGFASSVTGSDRVYSATIEELNSRGITAYQGSDIDIVKNADYVIYSSAIPEEDIELKYAKNEKIPCIERCELLGIIAKSMRTSIAIAGTHGKSTTTGIIDNVLRCAEKRATSHIGAKLISGDAMMEGNDYFLTEACEYKRSFLHLHPSIGVILNIDFDHPDEYSSVEDVRDAFVKFGSQSSTLVTSDGVGIEGAITYGYGEDATYRIDHVSMSAGKYTFAINYEGKSIIMSSPLYGKHNINNVVASFVVCHLLGIDEDIIKRGIETFSGLSRRFEEVGYTENGAKVITDYAHHPEEIKRVIATCHEVTKNNVIVVFEPHTYSRTRALIEGFLECFYWADSLILLPTYSARESESDGYSTLNLLTCLHSVHEYPLYFDSYRRAEGYLKSFAKSGDTILTLGAGSIDYLAKNLVK